jgi:hypothetical protein
MHTGDMIKAGFSLSIMIRPKVVDFEIMLRRVKFR